MKIDLEALNLAVGKASGVHQLDITVVNGEAVVVALHGEHTMKGATWTLSVRLPVEERDQ